MNENERQKPVISLIMLFLLHPLSIFKETVYLINFTYISFALQEIQLVEALPQNFLLFSDTAKPYWRFENKLFQHPLFFQIPVSSLYQTTKYFLAFIKATTDVFIISIFIVSFKIELISKLDSKLIYWIVFKSEKIWLIGFNLS